MKPLEVELSEGCMLRLYTGGRAEVVRILQGTELERLRSWVAEQRADVVPAPALKKKRRRRKQRQAASGPPVGKLAPRAASMKEVSNGEARAAIAKRAAKEKAQLVAPTPGRCDAVKRTGELCGRPTEGTSCGYHGGKRMTKPPSKPRGDRLAVIRELAEARRPATPSAAEDAVLEDVSELEFE